MPSPATSPRILLVRFSAMGDLILLTPLLRALRRRHPAATITLVTRAGFAPLFEQNPHLTELVTWDGTSSLRALARRLRATPWTHRLDLHGSLRSRALRWLVGGRWQGYPKHRIARAVLVRWKRNVYRDRRPVPERYFDAARKLDVLPDGKPAELFLRGDVVRAAGVFLAARGLGQERTLLALAPGAAHATKEWPERHWTALAEMLTTSGADVVILGGPAERALGERLEAAGGGRVANAAGHFDLQGTAALLRHARGLTAGDTGVVHMASALGVPAVVLLGPTVEALGFAPYHARATILQRDLPCRPCSAMGSARCPLGHHRCLVDILPADVATAIRKLPS